MYLLVTDMKVLLMIGISAMLLLFVSFLISFITSQRKKLHYHKELQAANEREQQILTQQKTVLEEMVKERTGELINQKEALQETLNDLKSTQLQLVQREKMASLGELTAGIAHEIQNPLNFVNNFSEVNAELLLEINEQLDKEALSADGRSTIESIVKNISQNLDKVSQHGKRADAIVKGMLLHSRVSAGDKELTDVNALSDEYIRLAYHGLRAKDKSFNTQFITELDPELPKISVIPQDIGRVLINLFNNAFYSVNEKKKKIGAGYGPTVSVKTLANETHVTIIVRDNGLGIAANVLEKIYHPFFTTKPTGQGTGLGLSLSYDIIKAHQGELKVNTKEGEFAEFIITLPLRS
ncbi:MAG: GHKL domain-containing protein [Chitinophagaceae bacterium]|nr:GHKL domain-containing protein [Chitinophagaceae bacterium]